MSASVGAEGTEKATARLLLASIAPDHPMVHNPCPIAMSPAYSRLDVDVALNELLHFLQSDERLPLRTRQAVQFLHGLRQQMVYKNVHNTRPDLFDYPLPVATGPVLTFKEVSNKGARARLPMSLVLRISAGADVCIANHRSRSALVITSTISSGHCLQRSIACCQRMLPSQTWSRRWPPPHLALCLLRLTLPKLLRPMGSQSSYLRHDFHPMYTGRVLSGTIECCAQSCRMGAMQPSMGANTVCCSLLHEQIPTRWAWHYGFARCLQGLGGRTNASHMTFTLLSSYLWPLHGVAQACRCSRNTATCSAAVERAHAKACTHAYIILVLAMRRGPAGSSVVFIWTIWVDES